MIASNPTMSAPALPRPMALTGMALDKRTLIEALGMIIPSWTVLALGYPAYGGYIYFALLAALCIWHWSHRAPDRISALILATLPTMLQMRNYFFYNSVQFIFLGAIFCWAEYRKRDFHELLRDRLLMFFIGATTVYWWLSFLITEDYSSNFRALELSLGVAQITLLYNELRQFRTALLALGLGMLVQGAALAPHGDRLGFAYVNGQMIGNPISYGLPVALFLLLTLVNAGSWILMKDHPVWRFTLSAAAAVALLLSTSRGSWLVAFACLCVVFVFDKQRRSALLIYGIVVVVCVAILTATPAGETLAKYLDKTFDADVSLAKRTTGRAEQWAALPEMMADSPLWGFGPGNGREVAAEYAGRNLALHSLYLHITAETGLIGLGALLALYYGLFKRGWTHLKQFGEPVPLIGTIAYMTAALSIQAIDATTGIFLGLGFLRHRRELYRLVTSPVPQFPADASWRGPVSQGAEPV